MKYSKWLINHKQIDKDLKESRDKDDRKIALC